MSKFLKLFDDHKTEKNKKIEIEKVINEIRNIDLVNTSCKEAFDILYNFHYRLKDN